MKIIKVVVDELPESCDDCPFPFGGSERPGWQCSIMEMTNDKGHWDIDDHTRPDWCPLVSSFEESKRQALETTDWVKAYIEKLRKQ
jgi:hypothetical protein